MTRPYRHFQNALSHRSWSGAVAAIMLLAGFTMIVLGYGRQSVVAAPLVQSASTTADLIISEYIDGEGNDRAVEIYNGTGSPIALDGYVLEIYSSSSGNSGTPSEIVLSELITSIDTGKAIVVVYSGSSAPLQGFLKSDKLLFDGNDAIVLRNKSVSGENTVDSFGQLGNLPSGGAWVGGGVTTKSTDLRRKPNVCAGRINASAPFDPSQQWTQHSNSDYTNLGEHVVACTQPRINEFVLHHVGSNSHEYIEVRFRVRTTYDVYTVLVVNGNEGTDVGRITHAFPIYDSAIPSNGYWTTGYQSDQFDNGTRTILLVRNFVGNVGDDIDTNDDGNVDVRLWSQRVDYVAVSLGRPGDRTYADSVVLTPYFDGKPGMPGGASRIPDNQQNTHQLSNWTRNYFYGEGLSCIECRHGTPTDEAVNTPGQPNRLGTGTPVPTGTITITPTLRPTITRTPGTLPANCMDVIINGGFEQNHEGWKFADDPVPARFASDQRSEGLRSVLLGNPPGAGSTNKVSFSSVRQLVKIPPDATVAYLTWDHYSLTQEAPSSDPSSHGDRQDMIVLAPNQMTMGIKYRQLRNETGWKEERVELTEYIGKNFYVYFNVYNDGNGKRTWMYLDDVKLAVCYPTDVTPGAWMDTPTAMPLPTLLQTPSATPTATGTATPTLISSPTLTVTGTVTTTVVPTMTVTSTATPTMTVTSTVTPTLTSTNTVLSTSSTTLTASGLRGNSNSPTTVAGCVELVANGEFEEQGRGWTFPSGNVDYTDEITFGGSAQSIRLGSLNDPNVADISVAEQVIELPVDYERIVLEFRYYPITDPEPGPGDLQYVDIHNFYTEQFEERVLSVQRSDERWLQQQSDISYLSDQRIRLRFAVNNDGVAGRSSMYVDNVSIRACGLIDDGKVDVIPVTNGDEVDIGQPESPPDASTSGTPGTKISGTTMSSTTVVVESSSSMEEDAVVQEGDELDVTVTTSELAQKAWWNQMGIFAILGGILVLIALLAWAILYALRPNR